MQTAMVIGMLVALLLLLGSLLYIVAQFLIRKMAQHRLKERTLRLWIWRGFIIVLLIYSLFLLMVNKQFLLSLFFGPLEIFLTIFMVIYFVALIELVIIDLLLPDIVLMWKRILVELIVFLLLCVLTALTFSVTLGVMG